jgi:hypothetical protein
VYATVRCVLKEVHHGLFLGIFTGRTKGNCNKKKGRASQDLNWLPSELETDASLVPTCVVKEHAGKSLILSISLKYPLFPNIIHHFELQFYNIF